MSKEQRAIKRLQTASRLSLEYYGKPLMITASGGKDSAVLAALAQRANIPFEIMHNHTTADAPETVVFIRQEFRRLENEGVKCSITYPKYKGKPTSMWSLISQKMMPPARIMRYCCAVLKESKSDGRFAAIGVRWSESISRRKRGVFEALTSDVKKKVIVKDDSDVQQIMDVQYKVRGHVCNPIVDWTDRDVWDYICSENIPCNPLYQRYGFHRVGCIGCPMAPTYERNKEFAIWPAYRKAYIRAFDKMLAARKEKGKDDADWKTGEDVFHWWMEDGVLPNQMQMSAFSDCDEAEMENVWAMTGADKYD